jgi:hypothetical protein
MQGKWSGPSVLSIERKPNMNIHTQFFNNLSARAAEGVSRDAKKDG